MSGKKKTDVSALAPKTATVLTRTEVLVDAPEDIEALHNIFEDTTNKFYNPQFQTEDRADRGVLLVYWRFRLKDLEDLEHLTEYVNAMDSNQFSVNIEDATNTTD